MTTFLFAGDSVTDCGRTFFDARVEAQELGDGWVRIVSSLLDHRQPEQHRFFNAGVSGDRVYDLAARWDRDVVPFEPEVLTILVGVNDSLRDPPTDPDRFEDSYASLLNAVPDSVQLLVVAEPFVVPVDDGARALRDAAAPHLELVRTLAASYEGAVLLELDRLFLDACDRAEPSWWAADGAQPGLGDEAVAGTGRVDAVGGS